MSSGRSRLDRFIARRTDHSLRDIKLLIAQQRIIVDGKTASSATQLVDQFSHVQIDNTALDYLIPTYIMLNKPVGVVSATVDSKHATVIDLVKNKNFFAENLHIPGRLDFNSTGLLLLTNDGRWSKQLSDPTYNINKCYEVTLERDLTHEYIAAFNEGMYFEYEGITTRPAQLNILSSREAHVSLTEGRYHQIKRMFRFVGNRVTSLHRLSMSTIHLDEHLEPGQYRALTQDEIDGALI